MKNIFGSLFGKKKEKKEDPLKDPLIEPKVSVTLSTEWTGHEEPPVYKLNFERKMITLPRPVSSEYVISSPYGWRNIQGKDQFHNGVDFKTPVNTPIIAVENGYAFQVGWENPDDHLAGFGFRIWQESEIEGHVFYIWYAHLSLSLVNKAENIVEKQLIAYTGNTGRSTGPHLHMGVRKKDTDDWWNIKFT
jgi:murein DD-endopeptidase MepM/ murein hydrolase activator NlpD